MIKSEGITPNSRSSLLVSVNALIDIDIGLFKLIKEEYLDPTVFDIEFFKKASLLDYIRTTYYRTELNPLYDISIIKDKHLLDSYYIEFNKEAFNDIFDRSDYTDVLKSLSLFQATQEIEINILYYNGYTKESLLEDQEKGILNKSYNLISLDDVIDKKLINKFNTIFLRSIYELDSLPIDDIDFSKNFYISSFRANFDELGRLLTIPSFEKLTSNKKNNHEFSIFDMYNPAIVKPPIKDNNDNKGEV